MAYRRTYGRKKIYKKKSWYNRKYTAQQIAVKAWKATKYLKGLVNSEMLHKDTTINMSSAQTNIQSLVAIAQGDTDAGRTGNSILLRNIYIRGSVAINNSVIGNTRVTLALVKDTQQISDTVPAVADIFQSPSDPDTLLVTNQFGRFKILWRKTYVLTPIGGGRNVTNINKYWKLYDHIRYNGSASTDIQKNGYYLVAISSESSNYPSLTFNTRIGYRDN